jgi:RNA exonuclease NGL2
MFTGECLAHPFVLPISPVHCKPFRTDLPVATQGWCLVLTLKQECDRLPDLLSSLPTHSHLRASGPSKLHGLVIFYRTSKYRVRASRTVFLDDEHLSPTASTDVGRRGGSRQTKNVGLIACLEDLQGGDGVVIATTHL